MNIVALRRTPPQLASHRCHEPPPIDTWPLWAIRVEGCLQTPRQANIRFWLAKTVWDTTL